MQNRRSSRLFVTHFCAALAVLTCCVTAQAERLDRQPAEKSAEQVIGVFDAIEAGTVEAQLIPLSAAKVNVVFKNLSDKPVTIQMPAAFAAVPVLAQMGGMGGGMGGGGMGGGGMGGGGGGGQAMGGGGGMGGGGMGGGGMGGGGMGGGGGMFNVPAGKTKKASFQTVCLEHGKPDPVPKMKYKMVPLASVTKDENIRQLCEALGNKLVSQNVAQAAAWHMTDDLSWNELASKNRVESKYTGNVKFFHPRELQVAFGVVTALKRDDESSDTSLSFENTVGSKSGEYSSSSDKN